MSTSVRSLVVMTVVVGALTAPAFAARPAPPTPPDYRVVRLNAPPPSAENPIHNASLHNPKISPVPGSSAYRVTCTVNRTIMTWNATLGACEERIYGGTAWLDVPIPGSTAPDVQDLTDGRPFPLLDWDPSVPVEHRCGSDYDTRSHLFSGYGVIAGGHAVGSVARTFGPQDGTEDMHRIPVVQAWNESAAEYASILLPIPAGYGGYATDATAAGLVVGYMGVGDWTTNGSRRAVQWQVDFSTATVLSGPDIIGDDQPADCPRAVNATGQSAGETLDDMSTATVGGVITATGATPLRPLQRDQAGVPIGWNSAVDITAPANIAGSGGVLAGRRGTTVIDRATLWRGPAAAPINLGGTRSSYSSYAGALREAGTTTEIVGRNNLGADSGAGTEAVRWRVTSSGGIEVKALQTLVSADVATTLTSALSVSNHGVIACSGSYPIDQWSTASRPCILFPR